MSSIQKSQKDVKELVERVKQGDDIAFEELKEIAKPLLVSISEKFSRMHHKFEFEDFYSICLVSLYNACKTFSSKNPCFLSFAKKVMYRQCCNELNYWNTEKRNIFEVATLAIDDNQNEDTVSLWTIETKALSNNEERLVENDVFLNEYHANIDIIISDIFDDVKAEVLRMHIFGDMRHTDIAKKTGLHYKNVYSIVKRGTERIIVEYNSRFLDKM